MATAKTKKKSAPAPAAAGEVVYVPPGDLSDGQKSAAVAFFGVVRDTVGAFARVGEQTLVAARMLLELRATFTVGDDEKPDMGGRSPGYQDAYRKVMTAAVPDEKERGRIGNAIRKRIDDAAKADPDRGWEKITLPPKKENGANTGGSATVKPPSGKAVKTAAETLAKMGETLTVNEADGTRITPVVPLQAAVNSLRYAEKMVAAKDGTPENAKLAARQAAEVAVALIHLTGQAKSLTGILDLAKARATVAKSAAKNAEKS